MGEKVKDLLEVGGLTMCRAKIDARAARHFHILSDVTMSIMLKLVSSHILVDKRVEKKGQPCEMKEERMDRTTVNQGNIRELQSPQAIVFDATTKSQCYFHQ